MLALYDSEHGEEREKGQKSAWCYTIKKKIPIKIIIELK